MEDKLKKLIEVYGEMNQLQVLNSKYGDFFDLVDDTSVGGIEDSPHIIKVIASVLEQSGCEGVASKLSQVADEVEHSIPQLLDFSDAQSKKIVAKREELNALKADIIEDSDNVGCLKLNMSAIIKGLKADAELDKIAEDNNLAVEYVGGRKALVFGAIKEDLINFIKKSDSKILKGALGNHVLYINETKLGDEGLVAHKGQIINLNNLSDVEKAVAATNTKRNRPGR